MGTLGRGRRVGAVFLHEENMAKTEDQPHRLERPTCFCGRHGYRHAKGLIRLGKALHRIGDGHGVERAMKAGLSEGSRKLKTRTKIMLQGITGIKLQRRITRGMRQIPARRSTDGHGLGSRPASI